MVTAKFSRNSQVTVPKPVRDHLGLRAGDLLNFAFAGDKVVLTKAGWEGGVDPFAAFAEWDSEADRRAYARL